MNRRAFLIAALAAPVATAVANFSQRKTRMHYIRVPYLSIDGETVVYIPHCIGDVEEICYHTREIKSDFTRANNGKVIHEFKADYAVIGREFVRL